MKIIKQKTPLSCIWQVRLFGRDFLWGYMNIGEAADLQDARNANIVMERADGAKRDDD